jgi:L,D-transpeptidase ErfK/SrfK
MTMRCLALLIAIIGISSLMCSANALAAAPIPHETADANQPLDEVSITKLPSPSAAATPAGGADVNAGEKALTGKDADENAPLPEYPMGARVAIGEPKTYVTGEEDTFADIARHFDLGYVELRAANPGVDPWAAPPGETLNIPAFKLLPRAPQQGIVVNLGEMRMYYFMTPGKPPLTFPLGIGREGLETPTGTTTIVRKVVGPTWFPTERMRKEKPWLPAAIHAGNEDPLGTHAMYLGWPTFLIHGSNKPWGIGRRVSSGCMRMYPEDIITMFGLTPVGTKVTVVNQPIKVGWLEDGLYLEANPTLTQSMQIEVDGMRDIKPMTSSIRKAITEAAGSQAAHVNWSLAEKVIRERRGVPVLIAKPEGDAAAEPAQKSSSN